MSRNCPFPPGLYFRKFLNTFFPKILLRLSPKRYWIQNHWRSQNKGDIHGFDKYNCYHPRTDIIISEIRSRIQRDSSILDLGCNCGYYLSELHTAGFSNLAGIDISPAAIHYGREHFNLTDVDFIIGSFEDILPQLISRGRKFDLIYSLGATIELVHPSFDIIRTICQVSDKYVILIINENGQAYPRFWQYEFNRQGFFLVKYIYPYDGGDPGPDPFATQSLMVFQRIQ